MDRNEFSREKISLSEAVDVLPEGIEDLSIDEIKKIMAQALVLINESQNEFLDLLEVEYGARITYETILNLKKKDRFVEMKLYDYSTMLFDRAIERIEFNKKI